MNAAATLTKLLAFGQGAYFLGTGLWPIFHLKSFYLITGPKAEGWLVKTVGLCVGVVGLELLRKAPSGKVDSSLARIAFGQSAALFGIDLYYVAKGRIPRVYLLDALAEFPIMLGWILSGKLK